jgi:LPS sulfotransferase NodH
MNPDDVKEDVNLTVAKVHAAASLVMASQGQSWKEDPSGAVAAAAEYLAAMFSGNAVAEAV